MSNNFLAKHYSPRRKRLYNLWKQSKKIFRKYNPDCKKFFNSITSFNNYD